MHNKKIYKLLDMLTNMIYIFALVLVTFNLLDNFDDNTIIINMIVYLLSYVVILFLSVIFHEIGHLFFGLESKLSFDSFNILCFKIYKEKSKLKIKYDSIMPGTLGYCSMKFREDRNYKRKNIILYFLGGIIFNIILVITSIILYFSIENLIIKSICLFFLVINLYIAIGNCIPKKLISGVNSDMLHICLYNKNNNYIKSLGRLQKIINQINRGKKLNELDEELFYIPDTFVDNTEIDLAMIYIEYLISKKEYIKANNTIKTIKKKANKLLSESQVNILKVIQIESMFYSKEDINRIKDIWDNDLEKYIHIMYKSNPSLLTIEYLYYKLYKKDNDRANIIMNQINKMSNSMDRKTKKEIYDFIKEIDE